MELISWDAFESLLQAASGYDKLPEKNHPVSPELLKNLNGKRHELDSQHKRFLQANEDSILNEYKNLRRLHHEFLDCYRKTHLHCLRNEDN